MSRAVILQRRSWRAGSQRARRAAAIEKAAPSNFPSLPNTQELLRLFYLGRPTHTIAAYRSDLAAFAAFAGAPSTESAVAGFLSLPKHAADAVAHEWKASLHGASSTRARRLAALRTLVKTAKRYGIINWELDLKMPRVEQYRDTAGPGMEALQAMLRAADELVARNRAQGLRARATLLLIGTLGLRRDEVAKLRVGHYNKQTRRLDVMGKGEKPVFVTVPTPTAQAVEEWIEQLVRREPGDPLIQRLDREGTAVSGRAIYKIIAALGVLAGVRTWPHGLRHTAVTETTRTHGVVASSKFARHSDVKTTMIYQDNLEDLAGKAAEALAERLVNGL